jgi:hypothetical protein
VKSSGIERAAMLEARMAGKQKETEARRGEKKKKDSHGQKTQYAATGDRQYHYGVWAHCSNKNRRSHPWRDSDWETKRPTTTQEAPRLERANTMHGLSVERVCL